MLIAVSSAHSQATGILTGIVTDVTDNPVLGVRVSLTGTSLVASTDERGEFRIPGITPGRVEIQIRRLGFSPEVHHLDVSQRESTNRVHFKLSALANTVNPVVVLASRVKFTGRLAGYYERLRRGSAGSFITRDEIDRRNYRTLSQLLAGTPGVSAMRSRTGVGVVRMRGMTCRPLVWLDAVPMPAGEVDLDAFSASTLHGIEIYLGGTNAPMDYTAGPGLSNCGTILLWSRGRDTEPAKRSSHPNVDFERLVASLSVSTSDQVDKPATLEPTKPLEVTYPLALFASGTGGRVVAEFVVDTAGRVEAETLAIIASGHPLFSEAVADGLVHARYSPALKNGKEVRQIVYQSFSFAAHSGKSRKQVGK